VSYRTESFFLPGRGVFFLFIVGVLLGFMQFSSRAAGSVTLAWQPSADTNVVGYNVYFGGASGVYTNKISAAGATNAVISNLVQGATYYFAVTAYDVSGAESPFSNEASYAVPLEAANQPPTLNAIGNLVINENAGLQTVNLGGISSGATNEIQTLTVTAVSSNPALIPAPSVNYTSGTSGGALTFAPAGNASGAAIITVTVNDGQTQNNAVTRTFTVTVNAVNPPLTLNATSKFYLTENGAALTVNLTGISSITANAISAATRKKQSIKITAESGNRKLVETPTIRYVSTESAGTMTFKPKHNAIGTTTITVTVKDKDKSNTLLQQTFTVTILAKGSSIPVTQPIPATLTIATCAEGQFAVAVSGSTDHEYIVQASTNLVNWVPVWTNTPPFTYTDMNAGQFSQQFYRSIPTP
jgi:Fibronectin type III domain/Bacterial Ig domain